MDTYIVTTVLFITTVTFLPGKNTPEQVYYRSS